MKRDWIKLPFAFIATAYFLWCAMDPGRWHFMDGVDLLVHEGGHLVFMFFGQFITVAGGTLLQVIIPILFVLYFLRQGQVYSAAIVLFWVGQSMLNVSVYAGDAVVMRLPLVGGDGTIHDWNFMLTRLGMLDMTPFIAGLIRLCGTLVIAAAAFVAIRISWNKA